MVSKMREYIRDYIKKIDKYISNEKIDDLDEVISNHLIKISFFQHERLIHLLVTLFYAILTILFLALMNVSLVFLPIAIILVVFLVLYIYHYFYLENSVQYLYKQYDNLKKLGNT